MSDRREHVIESYTRVDPRVRVYEFGARIDADRIAAVEDQMMMARDLYNEIVELMRRVFSEMTEWTLQRAGARAITLNGEVRAFEEAFSIARSAGD